MTAYTDKRRNNRLQTGGYNAYMFPGCYGNWGYSNMNWGYRDWDRWSSSPPYSKRTGSGLKSVMNKPRGDFGHKETDSFVFFFRQSSPFSQWYPSEFSVDGRKFNCAEQYMMFRKAKILKCDWISEAIMSEKNPAEQKRLGRLIPKFDQKLWDSVREEIVKSATMAKYSQNKELKEHLIKTYPKTLVLASRNDKIWGIGLRSDDPEALNQETWKGKNLLGKILTEVRDELLKEAGFLERID